MRTNKKVTIAAIIGVVLMGLASTFAMVNGNEDVIPLPSDFNVFPTEDYHLDLLKRSCMSSAISEMSAEKKWETCIHNAPMIKLSDLVHINTESNAIVRNLEPMTIGYNALDGISELKTSSMSVPNPGNKTTIRARKSGLIGSTRPVRTIDQVKNLINTRKPTLSEVSQTGPISDSDSGRCLDFKSRVAIVLQTVDDDGTILGNSSSKNRGVDCVIPVTADNVFTSSGVSNGKQSLHPEPVGEGNALPSLSESSKDNSDSNSGSIAANQSATSFESVDGIAPFENSQLKRLNRSVFEQWPVPKPKPKFLNRTVFEEWPIPKPKPKFWIHTDFAGWQETRQKAINQKPSAHLE